MAVVPPVVVPVRRAVVRPLAADRFEVRFTATGEMREKLRRAQELLSHAVPSGDLSQVFDRALTALIAELERKKFAAVERPRRARRRDERSRTVPAEVRRAVRSRDGEQCAFVSRDGRRCGERRFLEFHHLVPFAVGGPATTGTIALRCRAHNGYEVDRYFGPGVRRGGPVLERERVAGESAGAGRSGTSSGSGVTTGRGTTSAREHRPPPDRRRITECP